MRQLDPLAVELELDIVGERATLLEEGVDGAVLEIDELVEQPVGDEERVALSMKVERDECVASHRKVVAHVLEVDVTRAIRARRYATPQRAQRHRHRPLVQLSYTDRPSIHFSLYILDIRNYE